MRITEHAFQRYCQRTATDPFKSYHQISDDIAKAEAVSREILESEGVVLRRQKKDVEYIQWHNQNINHKMVGIVKNGALVTIIAYPLPKGGRTWRSES